MDVRETIVRQVGYLQGRPNVVFVDFLALSKNANLRTRHFIVKSFTKVK